MYQHQTITIQIYYIDIYRYLLCLYQTYVKPNWVSLHLTPQMTVAQLNPIVIYRTALFTLLSYHLPTRREVLCANIEIKETLITEASDDNER